MGQFRSIFTFEFLTVVKNKVYIAITIIIVLLIAGALSFNRITDMFNSDDTDNPKSNTSSVGNTNADKEVVAIKNNSSISDEVFLKAFTDFFADEEVVMTDKNAEEIKKSIESGEFSSAIYIKTEKSYNYIVNDATIYDRTTNLIDELLKSVYIHEALSAEGLTDEEIESLLNIEIESDMIAIRVNQADNYFYTYTLLIVLFMAIIMYGTLVATSVATEKSTRTMEILITSAKPRNLIFGKVLGAGLAGLMQFTIIILSAFVFFKINSSYFENDSIISLMFDMPASILILSIVFFVGGYFMYAFLYGAFASLVSRSEDVNIVAMPLQMIITVAYVLVMSGVISGNTNSVMMKVLSFIPLTSPMAMFVRISMGGPTVLEIAVSMILLLAGIILTGYISAGMYRLGVLMYGKSPKPAEVFKIMKQSISKTM